MDLVQVLHVFIGFYFGVGACYACYLSRHLDGETARTKTVRLLMNVSLWPLVMFAAREFYGDAFP